MKTTMRFGALFIAILLLCTPIMAFTELENLIYSDNEIDVFIYDDCSDVVENKILYKMTGKNETESMIMLMGLLCLFGHDLETGVIVRVFHNVNPEPLNCTREVWTYSVCLRSFCDYSSYVLESSMRTASCH